MPRYHLNDKTGEPNRCPQDRPCEGGYKLHYGTLEEAQAAVSWVYKTKPPRRGASKSTLSDTYNGWRRAAIDSLFESEVSLGEAWRAALKHFDGLCYLCGKSIYDRKTGLELGSGDLKATADHLIPASKGGYSAPGNLAPAHYKCNHERGDQPLEIVLAGKDEMLNRVRNFQKKYKFTPLDEHQQKEINDLLEMIWVGMNAQVESIKRLL